LTLFLANKKRKLATSLIDTFLGEQKAQACDIADCDKLGAV
jgi:hypothetical protein